MRIADIPKSRVCNSSRFPSSEGTLPVKLFPPAMSTIKDSSSPSSAGIDPDIKFRSKT